MKATGRGCARDSGRHGQFQFRRGEQVHPRRGADIPAQGRGVRRLAERALLTYLGGAKQTLRKATMLTPADKRAAFRKLHESGCFIIPNPFDVGSAMALQHLGFKALASTSAGFAWTIGKADNRVTVDDVCDHLAAICAAGRYPRQCRLRGRLCPRAGQGRRQCRARVKTGVAGPVDRGFYRRQCKTAVRSGACGRSHQGGAQGHRCRQQRRPAHRPLRGVPARAEGSEARDRPAHRLCRGRRRLFSMRPASQRRKRSRLW